MKILIETKYLDKGSIEIREDTVSKKFEIQYFYPDERPGFKKDGIGSLEEARSIALNHIQSIGFLNG